MKQVVAIFMLNEFCNRLARELSEGEYVRVGVIDWVADGG
jgi:ABC-type proline/glycine betaine transport system ATPase subunit